MLFQSSTPVLIWKLSCYICYFNIESYCEQVTRVNFGVYHEAWHSGNHSHYSSCHRNPLDNLNMICEGIGPYQYSRGDAEQILAGGVYVEKRVAATGGRNRFSGWFVLKTELHAVDEGSFVLARGEKDGKRKWSLASGGLTRWRSR